MIKKKRILIISAVFPPEPVVSASISFDLATKLAENHEVTVLSPAPSRPMGYFFDHEPDNYKFSHFVLQSFVSPESKVWSRFKESYSFGRACYKFILKKKQVYDVIYMNTWPLASQFWIVKAAEKLSIPVICHIQDIYPETLAEKLPVLKKLITKILLPVDKYITKRSFKVVTISDEMRRILINTRKLASEKVKVVHNWQDEERFVVGSSVNPKKKSVFTFMFLGNLGPVAVISDIIKAFGRANIPKSRLVIAGRGSEKENLKSLAKNFPESDIKFIEAPAGKVGEIQAESDVLIVSLKPGAAKFALPSKIPAYMFSSKPVIGYVDSGSDSANAIEKAGCGWITGSGQVESLSECMKSVSKLPVDVLNQMGDNGFSYAMINFSRKNNLSKLIDIILNK